MMVQAIPTWKTPQSLNHNGCERRRYSSNFSRLLLLFLPWRSKGDAQDFLTGVNRNRGCAINFNSVSGGIGFVRSTRRGNGDSETIQVALGWTGWVWSLVLRKFDTCCRKLRAM